MFTILGILRHTAHTLCPVNSLDGNKDIGSLVESYFQFHAKILDGCMDPTAFRTLWDMNPLTRRGKTLGRNQFDAIKAKALDNQRHCVNMFHEPPPSLACADAVQAALRVDNDRSQYGTGFALLPSLTPYGGYDGRAQFKTSNFCGISLRSADYIVLDDPRKGIFCDFLKTMGSLLDAMFQAREMLLSLDAGSPSPSLECPSKEELMQDPHHHQYHSISFRLVWNSTCIHCWWK